METQNPSKILVGHHHIICGVSNLPTTYSFTPKHAGASGSVINWAKALLVGNHIPRPKGQGNFCILNPQLKGDNKCSIHNSQP